MKDTSKEQKSILKKLKEIEKTKANLQELENARVDAEREKLAREVQFVRDDIRRNFNETIKKSEQIFLWLENFWKELDPKLRKELEILFPEELFLYGQFGVRWDLPREIFWCRDRRFMYDTPEYHWFRYADKLTKSFQPFIITCLHDHLYSGEFWKELDEKVAKKLVELNK